MMKGAVKFYDEDKGFGFIARDDGQPAVFVHARALERCGIDSLHEGERVTFELREFRGRTEATDISRVGGS